MRRGQHQTPAPDAEAAAPRRLSRRRLLGRLGLGAVGASLTAAVGGPFALAVTRRAPARTSMPAAAPLRIDHVTVIDPRDGTRHPGRSVLVRDGVIEAVTAAPTGPTAAPAGVQVIDGAGRFAVPGYTNMHTHVLQQPRDRLYLATMLAEGTTGFRQMAGTDDMLRHRAEGRFPLGAQAPRLLAMPGDLLMPFNAPSVSRVRQEISRQKALGADFIKLIQVPREVFFEAVSWAHENGLAVAGHLPASVTPGEASDAGFDSFEHLGTGADIWIETSAARTALRREEDTSGILPNWLGYLPFAAQVFSSGPVAQATGRLLINPALSDSPATVALLQRALDTFDTSAAQRLVETFARNASWQTPTLVRLRTEYRADAPEYADHPWLQMVPAQAARDYESARRRFLALPAATRSVYHQYYDTSVALVQRMHDAGVPLMTGTDGPSGNPGQDLTSEFHELAAAGLGPLDVLRATTTRPAAFLGRSDRRGTVAAGMDADLVLLDADPLQDVRHLSAISAVVRAGHYRTSAQISTTVAQLLAAAEA